MAALSDRLLGFQKRLADSGARFLIALWSRQTGKGFTTGFICARGAMTEPRSNWLVVAPTERQSLETLDKAKAWLKLAHIAAADTEEELDAMEKGARVTAKVAALPNGSKIYALPGRPASLRGFTGYLVLDEFAFFEDQKEVWKAVFAVIVNPMASIKRVIITSTPNGQGDMFHRLVKENFLEPDPARKIKWEVQKVTIHEAAREWEASGRLGGKSAEEYVAEVREAFDTPEAWPQEFECDFLDSGAAVFPFSVLDAAEDPEATERGFDPVEPGVFVGGFDFGGIGDPSVFWLARVLPGGRLLTREVRSIRGLDTVDQVEAVAPLADRCALICVDYTGPGRGFGDIAAKRWGEFDADPMKFKGGKVEKFTFTDPSKRELFTKLRLAFGKEPSFLIPRADWIRQDFHALQMLAAGNDFRYWSPRSSAGHSDACTAAALCRRAALLLEGRGSFAPRVFGRRRAIDERSAY